MHVNETETPIEEMNPGIRRTVQWLRSHGFQTCDSGDGKTREHECDRPTAYVTIRVAPEKMHEEADRLFALLKAHGVDLEADYEKIAEAHAEGKLNEGDTVFLATLEAMYAPADGVAVLDLACVDDARMFPAN